MTTWKTPNSAQEPPDAAFKGAPWTDLSPESIQAAARVPSMLSDLERRLYFWSARHWAQGAGVTVDLGAFAGGSTACLAEGLRQSGRDGHVYAFDRFQIDEATKENTLYAAGVDPFEGQDLQPIAEQFLAGWRDQVTLVPGELSEADWSHGAIEILAIDAAKTAETADKIAEVFFPSLVAGKSIIIHQDLLHWKVPWLPAQMAWLSQCFVPVAHCPQNTIVYLCTQQPKPEDLMAARVLERHDTELADAVATASLQLRDFNVDAALAVQARAITCNPRARRAKDFSRRP